MFEHLEGEPADFIRIQILTVLQANADEPVRLSELLACLRWANPEAVLSVLGWLQAEGTLVVIEGGSKTLVALGTELGDVDGLFDCDPQEVPW